MNEHRAHLLEAILVAGERGEVTLEAIRRVHPQEDLGQEDLSNLEQEGLVVLRGHRVVLTPSGRELAEDIIRRHRLAEVLLSSFLGLDRERASAIGCIVEHDLRPEMVDSVCTLLGHPSTCPHGNPIPAGACCRQGRTSIESQVVPLSSLTPGEQGRVLYVRPRNHQRLHRLTSLGLTPRVVLEVHQRRPAYCIRFENTELAIDRDVADDIYVTRL